MVELNLKGALWEYEVVLMRGGKPWLEVSELKGKARVAGEKRLVDRDQVRNVFYSLMERHSKAEVDAGRPPMPHVAFDGGSLCYSTGELPTNEVFPAARPLIFREDDTRSPEEREAAMVKSADRRTTIQLRYIKQIEMPNGTVPADSTIRASLVAAITAFIRRAVLARDRPLYSLGSAYYGQGLNGDPRSQEVGNGIIMLPGIRSVVQAKQAGLMLSLDVAGQFFYRPCGVIEFLTERLPNGNNLLNKHWSSWSADEKKKLFKALRAGNAPLKLVSKTPTKKGRGGKDGAGKPPSYHVRGRSWSDVFTERAAGDLNGWHKENPDFTVAQYYTSTERELRYPGLPCLDFSKKFKARDGTEIVKLNWVPLETLEVAGGQKVAQGELTGKHTREMIKLCAVPPNRPTRDGRLSRIDMLSMEAKEVSNTLGNLGLNDTLSTGRTLMDMEGGRLELPALVYGNGRIVRVQRDGGDWQRDTSNMAFYDSTPKNSRGEPAGDIGNQWVIIVWSRPQKQTFDNFRRAFVEGAKNVMPGAGIEYPEVVLDGPIDGTSNRTKEAAEWIRSKLTRKPRFILNIIGGSKGDGQHRPYLMDALDNVLGVPCLHVRDDTLGKASGRGSSSLQNILMKLNGRLGGVSHAVVSPRAQPSDRGFPEASFPGVKKKLTMVLGADVGHGAPGGNARSIVSLVGSIDPFFSRYTCCSRFNTTKYQGTVPGMGRAEVIVLLKEMALKLLRQFYINNRELPNAVVMVRDGVSEGEISAVLQIEVQSIIDALKEAGSHVKVENYKPEVSYIVCVKSSNVRLMGHGNDGDRNGNITAGTIVDSGVTSVDKDDFILSSHIAIQGTSAAKRYCVLYNDSSMVTSDIQNFIFGLCHTYSRCPRSVSIPAPTYYSKLVYTRMQSIMSSRGVRCEADAAEFTATGGNMVPLGGYSAPAADQPRITPDELVTTYKDSIPEFPVTPPDHAVDAVEHVKSMFW